MFRKLLILSILGGLLLTAFPVFAQYAVTSWVSRYNGPADSLDWARALALDGSGNVYVTGQSHGSGAKWDYATIKYLPNGDTAWVRRYNGPGNGDDKVYALALDGSGNVYVTGYSFGSETNADYATIKYDSDGDTAWVRRYNGPGNSTDQAWDLALDGSANVYVTGSIYSSGTKNDCATIKYLPNGDTAWVRTYNGPGNKDDGTFYLAVDDEGNIYATGSSLWFSTEIVADYLTIKYLPNGDTAWLRTYDGPGNSEDYAHALTLDGSGNLYVTGESENLSSATSRDYATIKYLPNGDTAWVRRYNGPGNDWDAAYAIVADGSGNLYVTGKSAGSGTSDDYATIKYLPNGDTAWVRRYNGPGNYFDQGRSLTVDDSGNVYVTGLSYGSGTVYDYATIKYYFNGDIAWVKRYNAPDSGDDRGADITVDDSGYVYVTGYSWGNGTGDDYATIKYVQFDSIPFAPAVNYLAGDGPYPIFCADLDGDGDLDLATGNTDSDNVSVLLNNGDGSFQTAVHYGAGDHPMSIFCADLDGDGDLDIAVANYDSASVSILKNNGNGTFQGAVNYGTGWDPNSVFCADLDDDADLDLAVANRGSDNISILKNNGDGSFQSAVNYGTNYTPFSVFCADLDGDVDLDLAVITNPPYTVSILKNNGDGTFQGAVTYGVGDYNIYLFCADLDGDFDLDIATANWWGDDVSILINNGNGTFQSAVNYPAGNGSYSVFCADLDGDFDPDLIVTNIDEDRVSILTNNGNGTFQSAVRYETEDNPTAAFCADLDADGDLDLAVADYASDSISVFENLIQAPANQPPRSFSLIAPGDQDTLHEPITFRWHIPYDPNFGDQLRYELWISTTPGFETPQVDSNIALSKFTKPLDPGTYWWKVKAKDNWGAETWSFQTWSVSFSYLTDTLRIFAFSPVDLIVTDPIGDSVSLWFNTIASAFYDTTTDYNLDGDKDDIVTIPNRLVGDYLIIVVAEPGGSGTYDLGIRIDGGAPAMLVMGQSCPGSGEVDTFHYAAPLYKSGDANGDWTVDVGDVVYLINYLYKGGVPPDPLLAADATCDGFVEVGDVVYLINYLFKGGQPPSC